VPVLAAAAAQPAAARGGLLAPGLRRDAAGFFCRLFGDPSGGVPTENPPLPLLPPLLFRPCRATLMLTLKLPPLRPLPLPP
jgi:hypothetical protein